MPRSIESVQARGAQLPIKSLYAGVSFILDIYLFKAGASTQIKGLN
jgi:hypothetical protein